MSDSDRLDGRVAIVTGGGRGIGEAIVRALADRGAKVVVADNGTAIDGTNPDPSLAQEIAGKLGDAAVAYTNDMAIPKAASEAVALAVEKFGGLDIVVNNAAILRDALIFKSNPDNWDTVIRNNLSGPYYLMVAAMPVLRENARAARGAEAGGAYGWGRIVNLVSTAGIHGNLGQAPYASSKAGLIGLTRVAALEMLRSGVTVNAVAPFARTRMIETIKPANEIQASYKERALKVPPSAVGTFVAYLCTSMAQTVTGQLFGVHGAEVVLFGQARPVKTIVATGEAWDVDTLARTVAAEFQGAFASLATDLEVEFGGAPS